MVAPVVQHDISQLPVLVCLIPDEWESITKNELKLAGSLRPHALRLLLEEDMHYASSEEQDAYYRKLLQVVRQYR